VIDVYIGVSLTFFLVALCLSGGLLYDMLKYEFRGDKNDWLCVCAAIFLPVLTWLWPLILALLVLALVLVIPSMAVYAPYRLYKAWKEES